ncbi:MAG: diphthine--ammonia ligase [Cyclobacteriaceae bacterium]
MSLPLPHTDEKMALCSWSGGKDSCFALMLAIENGLSLSCLLNVTNEFGDRSRSHGLKPELLTAQAKMLGVPISFISSSWADYESNFIQSLTKLKSEKNITEAIYGDIDIESHRVWEKKVSAAAGLQAHLPLWQQDRKELVVQMVDSGINAMIVSCNDTLGYPYLGRMIDKDIINEFEAKGVDPCGENGEYHTVVLDCPLFTHQIDVQIGDKQNVNGYNFLELNLKL